MTIKQLLYIVSVTNNNFNISETAEKLFTSQPGISKQIKLLEEGLGIQIFKRRGKTLFGLTEAGEEIIEYAKRALKNTNNIKQISDEYSTKAGNSLNIMCTQALAMYTIPSIFKTFKKEHPNIGLSISTGNADKIINQFQDEEIDCGLFSVLSSIPESRFPSNVILIPAQKWYPHLLLPKTHPLTKIKNITLSTLTNQELIIEKENSLFPSALTVAFLNKEEKPNIRLTTDDITILKSYIRDNLGIGIVNPIVKQNGIDDDLTLISLEHILPEYTAWLGFSKNVLLRRHIYEFAYLAAPVLPKNKVAEIIMRADTDSPKLDGLTKAYLKEIFLSDAQNYISSNQPFICAAITIKNYQILSEDYGYQAGNHSLQSFIEFINQIIRKGDRVYRFNDDTFTLLLPLKGNTVDAISTISNRISSELRSFINGLPKKFTYDYGISIYPRDSGNIHSLVEKAQKNFQTIN